MTSLKHAVAETPHTESSSLQLRRTLSLPLRHPLSPLMAFRPPDQTTTKTQKACKLSLQIPPRPVSDTLKRSVAPVSSNQDLVCFDFYNPVTKSLEGLKQMKAKKKTPPVPILKPRINDPSNTRVKKTTLLEQSLKKRLKTKIDSDSFHTPNLKEDERINI